MKRMLILAAMLALALPGVAFAKGPSEASITGPGLGKAIKISGPEQDGSAMMTFAEASGFFVGAFGQEPSPLVPSRPKGDLGPKYTVEYTVPADKTFLIKQDLWPYAKPYAVTFMAPGQDIFDMKTKGGWFTDSSLKDMLVAAGLPKTAAAATASSPAGFFSTGRFGALVLALLVLGALTAVLRRRFQRARTT